MPAPPGAAPSLAPQPPSQPPLCPRRLLKLHGVRMDDTHANLLLRMCYNRLRQAWVPGGYPPNRPEAAAAAGAALPGTRRTQERQRLLEVRRGVCAEGDATWAGACCRPCCGGCMVGVGSPPL